MEKDTIRQESATELQNNYNYWVTSNINQRDRNDDSFYVNKITLPNHQSIDVLIVADGMGGYHHGKDVSEQSIRKLMSSLYEELAIVPYINQLNPNTEIDPDTVKKILWESIGQSHNYIKRMIANNKWSKAGTTMVIALIINDPTSTQVIVGNVGDSPLFHYQKSTDQLIQITDDHSVTGGLVRGKMISEEVAPYHELRHQLEFYIGGDRLPKEPSIYQFTLAPDDLILICSDGVNGALTLPEIQEIINHPDLTLAQKSDQLLTKSNNLGETDNQTLILWKAI
jgi:protein phosphatase